MKLDTPAMVNPPWIIQPEWTGIGQTPDRHLLFRLGRNLFDYGGCLGWRNRGYRNTCARIGRSA
jgi:hypothetical protein